MCKLQHGSVSQISNVAFGQLASYVLGNMDSMSQKVLLITEPILRRSLSEATSLSEWCRMRACLSPKDVRALWLAIDDFLEQKLEAIGIRRVD